MQIEERPKVSLLFEGSPENDSLGLFDREHGGVHGLKKKMMEMSTQDDLSKLPNVEGDFDSY